MAFGIYILVVAITTRQIGSKTTQSIQLTHGTNLETFSTSQAEDDNILIPASTIVAFTDSVDTAYEKEYNSSVVTWVPITWNNATMNSKEDTKIYMENVGDLSSITRGESTNTDVASSETFVTYMTEKLETDSSDNHSFDAPISSTQTQHISIDESFKESEAIITEDANITTSSDQWNIKNTSRESRMFTTDATNEQHEYQLIILKSNCSVVSSENIDISLTEDLSDVGCTIYLRMNLSSVNTTRDELLRTLKKLNIKPNEFHMVETVNKNDEDASGHKQQNENHGFVLDPETLAYLAVAIAFAFLLLLAVMVFGVRCFRKRRPSLDISRFDVRLSNYTLTKIPRASLSAMDSLHESDCLDDKPESSTVRNKDCGSCESGLDIIPCDPYSSNREMKTFGVSRPSVSRNSNSPSEMYTQHNPIAYENHTFQRYF